MEYTINMMLRRHLDVHFGRSKPPAVRCFRIDPLLPALIRVLSTLANAGQKSESEARRAFELGLAEIGRSGQLLARVDCSLEKLDAALLQLAQSAPNVKRQVVSACVACVAADGHVTPREDQLVQATGAVLGVPVSPLVAPSSRPKRG